MKKHSIEYKLHNHIYVTKRDLVEEIKSCREELKLVSGALWTDILLCKIEKYKKMLDEKRTF
jgi:hypothetical protein